MYNGSLGLNIHAPGVHDYRRLYSLVERLRPKMCVFMDVDTDGHPERAIDFKRRFPEIDVVYRLVYPGDDSVATFSPQQFIESFRTFAKYDLSIYALNEPGCQTIDQAESIVDWCVRASEAAKSAGVRLVLANFAVGHPAPSLFGTGVFDPLLRSLSQSQNSLGVHLYALQGDFRFILGHRAWLDRARFLNLSPFKIYVTETGFDIAGSPLHGYRLHFKQNYADLLNQIGAVFAQSGIPAAVYCYGDFGWSSFSIQNDGSVENNLRYFDLSSQPSAPPSAPAPQNVSLTFASPFVNLRDQPSLFSKIIAVIPPSTVKLINENADWFEIEFTARGWVSKQSGKVRIK